MDNLNPGSQNLNKPPSLNNPIPLDDAGTGKAGVSRTPLDLGGNKPIEINKTPAPKPVAKTPSQPTVAAVSAPASAPMGRITGVRTFFTKLHPGAVNFLDEQITDWLKENPDIVIKRTNVTVGEIQAKKTEPNILVTVWY
jgi:hypothetical protein